MTAHAPCHLYPPDDRTAGARSSFCLPGVHEPLCVMCGDGFPCAGTDPDGLLRQVIAGPGAFDGMPLATYHDDPTPLEDGGSLSHSGAVQILPPRTPAHFAYWRANAPKVKQEWTFGAAVHTEVLGDGAPVEVVKADNWRTNAAKEAAATARALGRLPLLEREADIIPQMVQRVREHPRAGALLDLSRGVAERSYFWRHPRTKRWCRSRPDYSPNPGGRRFIMVDYKTANHADEDSFGKATAEHGYHIQHAMACAAIRNLGIHDNPEMVFVVQEKEPPFEVAVHFLPFTAMVLGERKYDQAVTLYDQCVTSGKWPGFGGVTAEPLLTVLPRWATYGEEDLP